MTILNLAKLIFLKEPSYLCQLLRILEPINSRNNRIYLPSLTLEHYKNNFCYQVPKIWNAISSSADRCKNVTSSPTMLTLKSRLKQLFLTIQSFGDETEWNKSNRNLNEYLISSKLDPYTALE